MKANTLADVAFSFASAASVMAQDAGLETVAMEVEGDFIVAACTGRFEITSRTDSIYFAAGSSRLDNRNGPLLNSIVEIVNRCPELAIRVDGHTDSDGSETSNQVLSEARARAVRAYLVEAGADGERIDAIGFGETLPVVANNSVENKQRNRRIEFSVIGEVPDA